MRYEIEGKLLSDIGDAIREKTGKNELILPGDMPGEIKSISSQDYIDEDYQYLKYIQSTGKQKIVTHVKIKQGDILSCLFSIVYPGVESSKYKWVLGTYKTNEHAFGQQVNSSELISFNGNIDEDSRYSYNINKIYGFIEIAAESFEYPLYIFSVNPGYDAGTAYCIKCRVYSLIINNLIYIPCKRKSDNICGLYNSYSKDFLTDALNIEPFIAG